MEMEDQLHRTTHHEEDPHKNAALHPSGGHNHEGEKKSVLKKVKDKAKKIKDTIKKHGHHEHDHEYRHDQVSEEDDDDDDDDDDEETVIHSDVHGAPAPITESAFISGTNLPKQTAVNLEKVYNPGVRNEVYPDVGDRVGVNQTRNSGPGPVELSDELKNPHLEAAGPKVRCGLMDDLAEDPHPPHHTLPLSSYQTKGPDPTARGGREADMKNIEVYSGVGDRVGVTKTRTPGPSPVELPHELKNPCSEAVSGPKVKIGPLEDLVEGPHSPNNTLPISNYQTKVADPTPQGGREADFAPLVQHLDDLSIRDKFESKPEQRSYTGSHDQFAPQSTPINDQLDPEPNQEMPKAFDADEKQSMPRDTIAGKISLATSAITDKAVSAKNVVASKLGYGSQDTCGKAPSESLIDYASGDSVVNPEPNREMPKGFDTNETESMPRDTIAGKISLATSVITDKAVSAKNVVASKLGYGSQDTCEKAPTESLTEYASGDGVVKDSDKGVSVKGYLIEKFSPGDEDKALSEAITDSMQKKKEGMYVAAHGESPGGGVVDRVKGTVSSWLGMSSGMNTAQHEYGGPGGEERRGIEEVDQSLKTSDK